MAYYGAMAKDVSKSKKPAFKAANSRYAPPAKPAVAPPKALHLLTIQELLQHFKANAGQLILVIERESRMNGGENHVISTRFILGLLVWKVKTNLGPQEFIPMAAYVPLDEETPIRREGLYVLRRPLECLNNRVHVGPASKKMLELVVGTEAVLAYDAAELSHREWRSRTAVAKRLLGKEEKRSHL